MPVLAFTVITLLIWLLIYRYVPETEGKTLEEIQIELRRKNWRFLFYDYSKL